jgi:Fe-S-cluster-containing hydrogenase component 2
MLNATLTSASAARFANTCVLIPRPASYNTYRSRIRTVRVDEVLITAMACRTCDNAPCVTACPQDALSQDPATGIIHINAQKCDACAWCVEACDFGAISINPNPDWRKSATSARIKRMDRNVYFGVQRKL